MFDRIVEKIRELAVGSVLAVIILSTLSEGLANGISNFEGVQCVSTAMDSGVDAMNCADEELPSCEIPDWFPVDAQDEAEIMTTLNSFPLSTTVRYNELIYAPPDSTPWVDYHRFEHDWYSQVDTAYGPALPSGGHLWNEYSRDGLIRSVSCDTHGTVSYP